MYVPVNETIFGNKFTTIDFCDYFFLAKHIKLNCTQTKVGIQYLFLMNMSGTAVLGILRNMQISSIP